MTGLFPLRNFILLRNMFIAILIFDFKRKVVSEVVQSEDKKLVNAANGDKEHVEGNFQCADHSFQ